MTCHLIRALVKIYIIVQTKIVDCILLSGAGQFGSVKKGECRLRNGKKIPVAVKTLKNEDVSAKDEVYMLEDLL